MDYGILSVQGLLRLVTGLLATILLLAGAHLLVGHVQWIPAVARPVLPLVFYGLAGGAALIAWRFKASRVVFTVALLAAAHWLLLEPLAGGLRSGPISRIAYPAIALLLPLNVLVLAFAEERGLLSLAGFRRLLYLAAQAALVVLFVTGGRVPGVAGVRLPIDAALVSRLQATADSVLHLRPFDPAFDVWTHLPQPAILMFGLAGIVLLLRLLVVNSPIDSGLIGALAAVAAALGAVGDRPTVEIMMIAAVLVLIVAVLQNSYRLAFIDDLTDLPGRRALSQEMRRLRGRYAVAMVDIDHFKKFNDNYGHEVGDQVLRMVSWRLKGAAGGGRAFRYGGEEFTLLFPAKSAEEALPHVEGLRLTIANSGFRLRGADRPKRKPRRPRKGASQPARGLSVTVSIGLAERSERHPTPQAVMEAADKALYRAKNGGRNRVVI